METKGKSVDILLVEDDPDHAELTIRALKDNNVLYAYPFDTGWTNSR